MKLESVEVNALKQLFEGEESELQSVTHRSKALIVVERCATPAGFYSLIRGPSKASRLPIVTERIWHFRMRAQRGYFVCWSTDDGNLLLEGVAVRGQWPEDLLPTLSCMASTGMCGKTRVWSVPQEIS